jgi:hypothetical protein
MEISNNEARHPKDLASRKYIRWDDDGVEKIQPNEEEDIKAVAEQINTIQRTMWNAHRHCFSGTSPTFP